MIYKKDEFERMFICSNLEQKAKLLNSLIYQFNLYNVDKLKFVYANSLIINKIITNKKFQAWIQS